MIEDTSSRSAYALSSPGLPPAEFIALAHQVAYAARGSDGQDSEFLSEHLLQTIVNI
jgi:hypothetical protein